MNALRWITLLIVLALTGADKAHAQSVPSVPQSQAAISLGFPPLVREAAPAVVDNQARRVVCSRSRFHRDPFFDNLLRDFGALRPGAQNFLGSGVSVAPDVPVVSNYHLIGQADQNRVLLNDRRAYTADVLMGDKDSNVAILKIYLNDMPYLSLRDIETIEVSDLVLAKGNAFGEGQTLNTPADIVFRTSVECLGREVDVIYLPFAELRRVLRSKQNVADSV